MLWAGLGFFGIGGVCFVLLATHVVTFGSCGGNGTFAIFGMLIAFPISLLLLGISGIRFIAHLNGIRFIAHLKKNRVKSFPHISPYEEK